jgi:hypothetical protein
VTNNPDQPVGEKTLRVHVFAAAAAGLVLVGGALYLWRRPATTPVVEVNATNALAAPPQVSSEKGRPAPPPAVPPSGAKAASQSASAAPAVGGPSLSEVRLVSCHDKGSKKTAPEDCDRLKPLEDALMKAVRESADCLPDDASNASIEYVADVSFSKKRVRVLVPSAHRSVKQRTAARCAKSVKKLLADLPLADVDHQHAQYKLAVTATYSKR